MSISFKDNIDIKLKDIESIPLATENTKGLMGNTEKKK